MRPINIHIDSLEILFLIKLNDVLLRAVQSLRHRLDIPRPLVIAQHRLLVRRHRDFEDQGSSRSGTASSAYLALITTIATSHVPLAHFVEARCAAGAEGYRGLSISGKLPPPGCRCADTVEEGDPGE